MKRAADDAFEDATFTPLIAACEDPVDAFRLGVMRDSGAHALAIAAVFVSLADEHGDVVMAGGITVGQFCAAALRGLTRVPAPWTAPARTGARPAPGATM